LYAIDSTLVPEEKEEEEEVWKFSRITTGNL